MLAFKTISLVVMLTILHICLSYPSIRIRESERPKCRGCGNECDKCKYGVVISSVCGVLECRKGPDEHCGGLDNIKGVCGVGMSCLCERCTGCSLDTYTCAKGNPDEPCRPRDVGYFDFLRSNTFTLV